MSIKLFQFLIGSMKEIMKRTNFCDHTFQFLIGSMKVKRDGMFRGLCRVSIPYRFNESKYMVVKIYQVVGFQFLIGSMKGYGSACPSTTWSVSIPYRFNESSRSTKDF